MKYWSDSRALSRGRSRSISSASGSSPRTGGSCREQETDWSKGRAGRSKMSRPQLDAEGMSREYISYARCAISPDGDGHPVFWGTSRPRLGRLGLAFRSASRNCRSIFPSSASTSSNGRLSRQILSFRTRRKTVTTRSPTRAGRKRLGASLRAFIPPEPSDISLSARTPARPAQERLPRGDEARFKRAR